MDPSLDNLIPTLIQLPFLAAFIWFSLRLQQDFRQDSKEREDRWMLFLEKERETRQGSMMTGMDHVKAMTQAMGGVTEALTSLTREMVDHTASSSERHDSLIRTIENVHRRIDEVLLCQRDTPPPGQ